MSSDDDTTSAEPTPDEPTPDEPSGGASTENSGETGWIQGPAVIGSRRIGSGSPHAWESPQRTDDGMNDSRRATPVRATPPVAHTAQLSGGPHE